MIKSVNGVDALIVPQSNGTDSATSESATNTVLSSVFVPASTIDINTVVRAKCLFRKGVANLTAYDASLYWSSGNTIDASAVLLGSLRINGETSAACIQRTMFFNFALPNVYRSFVFNPTINTENDFLLFNTTVSSVNFNSTNNWLGDGYFMACAQRATISRTNDVILCSYIYIDI